jgi:hypothetical protein
MNELRTVVDVPWELIAPIIIFNLILMAIALTDCIRAEETNGPKWMWCAIIIFVNIVGPVAYFVFGKKRD